MGEELTGNLQEAARMLQDAAADLLQNSEPAQFSSRDILMDMQRSKLSRREMLPLDWSDSPVLDMVIEVYSATVERRDCYVKHAVLASGVPQATASRHLQNLVTRGWILRSATSTDGRRVLLTPSQKTSSLIASWISQRKKDLLMLTSPRSHARSRSQ